MTVEKSAWKRESPHTVSFFIQFFCLPSLVQYNQLLKQLQAVGARREREREKGNLRLMTSRLLLTDCGDMTTDVL